jgi:general secretion pathway protein C
VLKPAINLQLLSRHSATVASFILLIVCAHTLAKLTWMLVPGSESTVSTVVTTHTAAPQNAQAQRNAIGQLTLAHLFGTAEIAAGDSKQVATETRLNLVLRGVFAASVPEYGIAIIASGKNSAEEVYGIGDTVPGNARLHEVHAEDVILERNGQLEILKLTKEEGLDLLAGSAENSALNTSSANSPAEALGQIRKTILRNPTSFGDYALPMVVKENGKQIGYRLQPQANGKELLSQIGLEASDVITSINGVSLDNPQNGISALRKLSTAQSINIVVKRNGVEVPLNIQLQ